MKSNTYDVYTHPWFEVIEVEMESAVLQSSIVNGFTEDLNNETFTW